MSAEKDLSVLLRSMKPELKNGTYVFATVPPGSESERVVLKPLLTFREEEGTTYILDRKEADRLGLSYDSEWALITLNVHSSLQAVGFLAEIAAALAEEDISVNVVSAFYHDHLFVPAREKEKALEILKTMTAAR